MDAKQAERLMILEGDLAKLDPELLDMELWTARMNGKVLRCALGHACLMEHEELRPLFMHADGCPTWGGIYKGFKAAEAAFGVEKGDLYNIFFASNYPPKPTPADVCLRIREVVKKKHPQLVS